MLLLLSHVRVGEYEAWERCCCCCVIVIVYGEREGVAGMQTHAVGMGMSTGQQDHIHTHTHGIP